MLYFQVLAAECMIGFTRTPLHFIGNRNASLTLAICIVSLRLAHTNVHTRRPIDASFVVSIDRIISGVMQMLLLVKTCKV